jgi:hypothetical protein
MLNLSTVIAAGRRAKRSPFYLFSTLACHFVYETQPPPTGIPQGFTAHTVLNPSGRTERYSTSNPGHCSVHGFCQSDHWTEGSFSDQQLWPQRPVLGGIKGVKLSVDEIAIIIFTLAPTAKDSAHHAEMYIAPLSFPRCARQGSG